jgi:hypothetical protein
MSNEISENVDYKKLYHDLIKQTPVLIRFFHRIDDSPNFRNLLKLFERNPEIIEAMNSLEKRDDIASFGELIKASPDTKHFLYQVPDIIVKLKPVLENIDEIHEVINEHKARAKFKGQMLFLIEKLNCEIQKLYEELALQRVILKKTLTKRQNSPPRLREHYRNPATLKRFSTTLSQQKHSIVSQRKLVTENNVKPPPIVPKISIDGVVVQRG